MLTAIARKSFRGLPGEGESGFVRAGVPFNVEESRFKQLLANGLVEPNAAVAVPQFQPVNAMAPEPQNKMKPASRRRRSPA